MKILGEKIKNLKECLEILKFAEIGSFVTISPEHVEQTKIGAYVQELEATLLVKDVKVEQSKYPVALEGNDKFQMEINWEEKEFSNVVMIWHSYSHTEKVPGYVINVKVEKIA